MNDLSDLYKSLAEKEKEFVFPSDSHYHQIEVAAYFNAEHRGFVPGHELDDWLEAESELQRRIASPYSQ
jgi:hypothetical protein